MAVAAWQVGVLAAMRRLNAMHTVTGRTADARWRAAVTGGASREAHVRHFDDALRVLIVTGHASGVDCQFFRYHILVACSRRITCSWRGGRCERRQLGWRRRW